MRGRNTILDRIGFKGWDRYGSYGAVDENTERSNRPERAGSRISTGSGC
jgi:hypothetical protein